MKLLRKANLFASIFLFLISVTSIWIILDSYTQYGWRWKVQTIIKGENQTHVETIATLIAFSLAMWTLAFLTLANYLKLRQLQPVDPESKHNTFT